MSTIVIKPATKADLPVINKIISDCVMGWNLSDRVKGLSLDSYHYTEQDMEHQEIFKAETGDNVIVAVLVLEETSQEVLLLHGIYVSPAFHANGIGHKLVAYAQQCAAEKTRKGVLVKAQPDANGFFARAGFERLAVVDERKDYAHRWWKKAG